MRGVAELTYSLEAGQRLESEFSDESRDVFRLVEIGVYRLMTGPDAPVVCGAAVWVVWVGCNGKRRGWDIGSERVEVVYDFRQELVPDSLSVHSFAGAAGCTIMQPVDFVVAAEQDEAGMIVEAFYYAASFDVDFVEEPSAVGVIAACEHEVLPDHDSEAIA